MENKEIYIDGVDVSGCPHYKTGDCLISPVWCDQFYNCDYKQLKRAEKTMQEIWDRLGKTSDELLRKEQECEELKIYIESNEQQVKEAETLVMDNDRLINELDQLKADREDALKQLEFVRTLNTVKEAEIRKLSKTLTEIKEICNSVWGNGLDEEVDKFGLILQKISECEGNDE